MKSTAAEVIPQSQAQLNISFSCSTTLIRGLDLLHQDPAQPKHFVQIASGAYRLLPYALEYWIEHCLRYAASGGPLHLEHPISRRLTELWGKHSQLLQTFEGGKPTYTNSSQAFNELPLDNRLKYMAHLPIYDLMSEVLRVRWLVGEQLCENGEGRLIRIYSQFHHSCP